MTNRFELARDLRQLRFMLSTVRSYQSGASSLPRLRGDLSELLLMLSDEGSKWQKQFRDALEGLEKGGSKAVKRIEKLLTDEIKRREREQPGA